MTCFVRVPPGLVETLVRASRELGMLPEEWISALVSRELAGEEKPASPELTQAGRRLGSLK